MNRDRPTFWEHVEDARHPGRLWWFIRRSGDRVVRSEYEFGEWWTVRGTSVKVMKRAMKNRGRNFHPQELRVSRM